MLLLPAANPLAPGAADASVLPVLSGQGIRPLLLLGLKALTALARPLAGVSGAGCLRVHSSLQQEEEAKKTWLCLAAVTVQLYHRDCRSDGMRQELPGRCHDPQHPDPILLEASALNNPHG
jgi:hypothetical protein